MAKVCAPLSVRPRGCRHRNYTIGGLEVPGTAEVQTPALDELVASGIELDRAYAYKCCSPTRSAIQSGRHPYHVNALNAAMEISNPEDPVSGFAGIPRNMTGIATKLAAAGYSTAMFGKWVRSQLPVASSISCCSILDRATGCRHGHARPYPEGARIPEEPVLLSPRQRL